MTEFSPSSQPSNKIDKAISNIDATLAANNALAPPTSELMDTAEVRGPNVFRRVGHAVTRFAARLVSPEARAQHRQENHEANVAAQAFLEGAAIRSPIAATHLPVSRDDIFMSPESEKWGRRTRN